jgi:cytochrome c biogenesis protein CcdA
MKQKALLFFLFGFFGLPAMAQLVFTPTEWDMGVIASPAPLKRVVVVENKGDREETVQVIPTCDCSTVDPASLTVAPHGKAEFTLSYNPKDDTGQIDKYFIIRTSVPKMEKAFFSIRGTIGFGPAATPLPESTPDDGAVRYNKSIEITLYHVSGCKTCEHLISVTFPALEKEFQTGIILHNMDISDEKVYQDYQNVMAARNIKERELPVLFAGKAVMQGFREIEANLRSVMTDPDLVVNQESGYQQQQVAIWPALGAGLIDGFNPCAFSTIVALLTALTLAGRRRQEILIMGIIFTVTVFITYFLIGLGLFKTIRAASGFPIVAIVLQWIIISVLIVFAGLSFYDYYLIRTGRREKMILQLPESFKKRINTTIKAHARSRTIVASSIILGVLVSVIELGCTGQVYFPFITVYVLGIKKEAFGYVLLLLYNLMFILPLVLVFIVSYFGLSSKALANALEKRMGMVKVLLGLLFIGLAALTIYFLLKG